MKISLEEINKSNYEQVCDLDVAENQQGFVAPSALHGDKRGIVIEDDVMIGANCTILEGARIRKGAVISAGSIVKGEFEEYGIYTGNPLKCIGYRRE